MNTLRFAADLTIGAALTQLAALLAEAGIEEPKREARQLLVAALAISQTDLITRPEQLLGLGAARLDAMTERRMKREPLSRIRGRRAFMGLDLAIDGSTLDPRPETEHLVEAALARFDARAPIRILDLGTGSGAILMALLNALPEARGIGVDRAEAACRLARENAAQTGVAQRAQLICGDLAEAIGGGFDLVVSNPPYIPTADLAALDPEVRDYDPALALDGGADGLDFYRRIAREACRLLRSGGLIAVEIGAGQERDVRALFEAQHLQQIASVKDYAGHIRVVLANKSNDEG